MEGPFGRTSIPQTSRVESACAKQNPLLMKYFSTSPGAVVTSTTPGLSSEMVGTWPGSTPNMPSAPGMITWRHPARSSAYCTVPCAARMASGISGILRHTTLWRSAVAHRRSSYLVDLLLAEDRSVRGEEVEGKLRRDALRLGRLICQDEPVSLVKIARTARTVLSLSCLGA